VASTALVEAGARLAIDALRPQLQVDSTVMMGATERQITCLDSNAEP
jgi:hypothetical protein